jgi:NAD dependent epimerase/dehydratase
MGARAMTAETVLVTGAGGFIGSHLVEALLERGLHVRAMVRYTSGGGAGFLDGVARALNVNGTIGTNGENQNLEIFHGDIRDDRAVRQAAVGCRRIYHLAALIGIPYSYVAPDSYVAVNVQGTLHVLEAARDLGTERVVVTSTSEVYGTAQYTPIDEKHPLNAQSPYAATKVGADQLALSYHRSFGLPVAVVRPFNTYGPRQSARAVIPTIITQALASDAIRLGSLDPVRDLVYVKDTAAGFIALADAADAVGKVTNLATGVGVTIGELVERIRAIVGRDVPVVQTDERRRPEASEVFRLLGSARQAQELAGWQAGTSLDEGLKQTVEWVRANLRTYRIGEYRI